MAHDVVHGTTIKHGYVLIALQSGGTQEFSTTGAEFERYKSEWMERVEQFLSQASAASPPASQPPQ